MERIRMAVVGVGALGRHHARILSQNPEVELIGVADPNRTQGSAVAEASGCEWTPDYRTLLGRVDAATIVTPTAMHAGIASDFLRRSTPVLVEKPLAMTADEGRLLARLAAEHKVPIQVGHIERFNPAFETLAQHVTQPRYLRCERFSPYAFRSMEISAVHDLMIHDIELCLHLADAGVDRLEAFGTSLVGGHEDGVQARITFSNGCVADLSALRVCPFFRRSILAWSDDGCVYADLHERKVTRYGAGPRMKRGETPFALAQKPGADIAALKETMFTDFVQVEPLDVRSDVDALTAELNEFLECVRGRRKPRVDARAGVRALEIADRIVDAIRVKKATRLRMSPAA